MPWGWYLSADFQLFLVLPLFLWVFMKSRKAGQTLAVLMIFIGLLVGFLVAY